MVFINMQQMLAFLTILHTIVLSLGDQSPSKFGYCLQQKPSPGIFSCVGRQALTALQQFEESDNFTITNGLVAVRQETGISRSLPNFVDQDPTDLRGMLENAGVMVSQRSLQWDLSRVYPGLQMKIGPSYGSMGVLEFVMDKSNDRDDRTYLSDEPSTARILTKQFVLPFLLGLKFNMMTLLPIIIAAIIFVSKKAAFLGKIALVLSGLFSTGTLFSLSSLFTGVGGGGHDHHYGYHHKPIFQSGYKDYDNTQYTHHHHHNSDENLSPGYYKNLNKDSSDQQQQQQQVIDNFYDYEKKVLLRDRISKLYEREINDEPTARSARQLGVDKPVENQSSYRNFAWQTQQN